MSGVAGALGSGGSKGGSSLWGAAGSFLGGMLGGGSGGGSGSSNIWQSILGGLGGAAQSFMDEKQLREAGKEQRKTLRYGAELQDFYAQKDKYRKRRALDTYGQFSLMDRYAPGYTAAPPLDQPTMPGA